MLTKMIRNLLSEAASETGAVLIVFAFFASIAIGFTAFVIDAGNWFEHDRHLQLQADAGAFAAGQSLAQAFNAGCTESVKKEIYETAARYSGATEVETPEGKKKLVVKAPAAPFQAEPYNQQVGGSLKGSVHAEVNMKRYYQTPGGTAQKAPEDTTVVEKAPCDAEAAMVDVKLTEASVPWLFKIVGSAFNVVPYVNAHARVSILQESSASGIQPLAVAQTAPAAVKAFFVNEDEGNKVLAESTLRVGSGGEEWSSEAAVPVEIKKTIGSTANIGVVTALSGQPATPKAAGTLAEKCKEAYVRCFDQTNTGPIIHIAGYSLEGAGSTAKPIAREVKLEKPAGSEGCSGSYFSNSAATCKFAIAAKLDYGKESGNSKGVTVKAQLEREVSGKMKVFGEKRALTLEGGVWKGTEALEAGTGLNRVTLIFECAPAVSGSACASANKAETSTLANVQRIYASSTARTGPVSAVSISETAPEKLATGANAFEVCEGTHTGEACKPRLGVTIRVEPSLADAARCATESACKEAKGGFFDSLHPLKFEGNKGQIAECRPGENAGTGEYRSHLKEGCPYTYKTNDFGPSGTFTDPECKAEEPYDCIAIGLKGEHNGARSAVGEHFETPYPAGTRWYCHNSWQNNNKGGLPSIPSDDSRLVQVFIVPFGAINEEGEPTSSNRAVPIEKWATFYVTGFYEDRCVLTSKEREEGFVSDDPVFKELENGQPKEAFEIIGHFIKYVSVLGESNGSRCKTEVTAIETCVVTLTE